ncbi:MAG TPA: trehalase family glycosidase, partial [Opitutales bacterium]|nr:trehalase family glycosidase [Opitutales bacterium]
AAYLQWDADHRNGPHGLPCWAIEANPNCRSGESGLDNASRFDAATRMEAVDFASFLALEWELLGRLHQRLGKDSAAKRFFERRQGLNEAISKHLWDAHSGIFRDLDLKSGTFSPVAAVTGFLPLICGAASVEQARRLTAHLDDPATFGTPLPLPSVARDDPTYERDMWRGPVWVNMVHLVAMGCERYGYSATANRLRSGIIAEIERWHKLRGTLFEYYDGDGETPPDQLLRKGRLAPDISPYHQCFHDYGWTGTLYLDMLLAREPVLPSMA